MSIRLSLNNTKRKIKRLRDRGLKRRSSSLKKSVNRFSKKERKNSLRGQENFRNSLMKFTKIKTEGDKKSIKFQKARKKKSKGKKKMKRTSNL